MSMIDVAFAGAAALTLVSSLAVVFFRNVLYSAVALFFSFLGIAILYVLLNADFLAIAQILIYAGGVLVLIIFGVFFTSNIYKVEAEFPKRKGRWIFGGVFCILLTSCFAYIVRFFPQVAHVKENVSSIEPIGNLLLGKYLLPFEIISILLLFVMIGAARIMKREVGESEHV